MATKQKKSASKSNKANEELEKEKAAKLQLMADFDNFRKRMEAERATFGALANMGLIQELLEVFDDLQLALNDETLELESAKTAIQNAQQKLKSAAKSAGVEALEINTGDEFDQERMEAITSVPDEKNKGKVVAVISSGFKYAGKAGVLKPAKVVVGK